MSQLFIESEYDMDLALAEAMKLLKLNTSNLDLGFNNMKMVSIFLDNLKEQLTEQKIDPNKKSFNLHIMVKTNEQA